MRVNANTNADERTQVNARTHLNNAEFYMPNPFDIDFIMADDTGTRFKISK